MPQTIQHPAPLEAATYLEDRYFSTIGNPELKKVRVLQSTRGRQLALILENASLTVFSEAVHDANHDTALYHKRSYGRGVSRNSNLNFEGSRLGSEYEADCWVFERQSEFHSFVDWYAAFWGRDKKKGRKGRVIEPSTLDLYLQHPVQGLHVLRAYIKAERLLFVGLPTLQPAVAYLDGLAEIVDVAEAELEEYLARGLGSRDLREHLLQVDRAFDEYGGAPSLMPDGPSESRAVVSMLEDIDVMLERKFEELQSVVEHVGAMLRGETQDMPSPSWLEKK